MSTKEIGGLYYPFSRCVDINSFKQKLLFLDQIVFLDPVGDEGWRAKLFSDLAENQSQSFEGYEEFRSNLPFLMKSKVVRIVDPSDYPEFTSEQVSAEVLRDLDDDLWQRWASQPEKFNLPSYPDADGKPTWQMFSPKIPTGLIDVLHSDEKYGNHLIEDGGEHYSSSFSYAAGSAVAMSVHLEAAQRLNLAPVTDSELHHRLLIRKTARKIQETEDTFLKEEIAESVVSSLANQIVSHLMPLEVLELMPVEDILAFRSNTETLRRQFVEMIRSKAIQAMMDQSIGLERIRQLVFVSIQKDLADYEASIGAVKLRLAKKILDKISMPKSLALGGGGTVAALVLSGGTAAAMAASASVALIGAKGYINREIQKRETAAIEAGKIGIAFLSQLRAAAEIRAL